MYVPNVRLWHLAAVIAREKNELVIGRRALTRSKLMSGRQRNRVPRDATTP